MPGICGIVANRNLPDPGQQLDAMLQRMQHEPWYRTDRFVAAEDSIAVGRVTLGFIDTTPQPAIDARTSSMVILDGEIYRADELRAWLRKMGNPCQTDSHAEILLRGYQLEGKVFLVRVDGRFSAAIRDAAARCVILVNDKFGTKPLYYARTHSGLVFASEIKSLFVSPEVSRTKNPRGIAQFFAYGQLWGEDTFYEAVKTLPAAAWIEYSEVDDSLFVDRYWHLEPSDWERSSSSDETLNHLDDLFKRSFEARLSDDVHYGISLSGGLDARTILGVADHGRTDLSCVSLGMDGSLDRRTSEELAHRAGCPYHGYVLGEGFLSDFESHLERMVMLTDGHYLSQCIVMPTLAKYRELGVQVLIRGHAGELMHLRKAYNFSLDRSAFRLSGDAALEGWLFERLRAYMLEGVDGQLFAFADAAEIDQLARDSLRESLAETAAWNSPINRISHLFITQRTRRETAMSLAKLGSVVETRLPYVEADLVSALLAAPPQMRFGETIQGYILRKRRPEFLSPANSNTGAAVGANALTRKFKLARMKVFARLGVKGYQPYERFGLWLRRELRPTVEKILLDEACLDRGIFAADTVRQIVRQHLTGDRNHTFLVLAMMIFELGQQRFVDAEQGVGENLAGCGSR